MPVLPLLELQWIWWFSLAAFLGVLLASNVGPTSSASYLVIGNMLFVGLTLLIGSEKEKKIRLLTWIGAILFVTSLLMCKGFYMRNTEYVPGDITDGLVQVKEGPLHGIYVKKEDALRFTSDYHTIQENTTKDDQVLFMGTESLCNLYANGRIVLTKPIKAMRTLFDVDAKSAHTASGTLRSGSPECTIRVSHDLAVCLWNRNIKIKRISFCGYGSACNS